MMIRTDTRVAIRSTPNPSFAGEDVSFEISVAAAVPEEGRPSGTVTLFDGGLRLGRGRVCDGRGIFAISTLRPGVHQIAARFERNDMFKESVGELEIVHTVKTRGYWLADGNGAVFPFGDAGYFGSLRGIELASPVVAIVSCGHGVGYWLASTDGAVSAFGECEVHAAGGRKPEAPVVGMAALADGAGYWLASADGAVSAFGTCEMYSAKGGKQEAPVVGIAATPTGDGFWLASADGRVTAYGGAPDLGSASRLTAAVAAIVAAPDESGYWLVAADGRVLAFGEAEPWGSVDHIGLLHPIVGAASDPGGHGYLLAGSDGGVFARGLARYDGSLPSEGVVTTDIIGVAAPR